MVVLEDMAYLTWLLAWSASRSFSIGNHHFWCIGSIDSGGELCAEQVDDSLLDIQAIQVNIFKVLEMSGFFAMMW